ncbi:MAG TPA: tetratricopeptide repeat protein [Candidatus Acidoferrales bacterium]|nr:tetratricopeptide repeat protein [Candidatus Acidoferrales bacterium]
MSQRYTRKEVGRILGVDANRLRYWERLRLVRPEARWGERFYSFGDLVALRTVKRLTENHVPAQRVRRAVALVEQQFGEAPLPLQALQFLEQGRDVLVIPPGAARPFSPIKQQWAFAFEAAPRSRAKLHAMASPTPEDLFQSALDCETSPDTMPDAVDHYRRVLDLAPNWVDAHINLGVALYQMGDIPAARAEFLSAVQLDPLNGIGRYNLGCVLEEQGEIDEAIDHLRRAARAMPAHADVHFNLALAHEKRGERSLAREQWLLYLRYAPNGPWAEQARVHLKKCSSRRKRSAPIPFPRKA